MAGIKDISSVWKNIKEIDLKPIRESATRPVRIELVGADGAGKHTLAEQMRSDPARPGVHTQSTLVLRSLEPSIETSEVDLIIVMIDATRADVSKERILVKKWSEEGKNTLVFINKIDLVGNQIDGNMSQGWWASRVTHGSVNDIEYLQGEFAPTVLELLPQDQLALGRQFPLFRLSIARKLINETCFSNAAYAFSTGLAEIVPVLDIPLNVTDMVVLTKSQAFLAYKLGLLVGFSTSWQDYVTEFGSVIGSGFMWRQIARQLVGLIPAWGIVPKVAVAYSGTYVVGNAILGWYLTGRNLSPKQMRELYAQAFVRGKEYAKKLTEKVPRPRLRKRKREQLPPASREMEPAYDEIVIDVTNPPALEESAAQDRRAQSGEGEWIDGAKPGAEKRGEQRNKKASGRRTWVNFPKKKEIFGKVKTRVCTHCGKNSAKDARYCQYCGHRFDLQSEQFDNNVDVD